MLHFSAEGPLNSNIMSCHELLQDVLDKGVIPFAMDVGHDVFCFNYRKTPQHPSVVFWGQGFGMLPIAPDFEAFVNLLHD